MGNTIDIVIAAVQGLVACKYPNQRCLVLLTPMTGASKNEYRSSKYCEGKRQRLVKMYVHK